MPRTSTTEISLSMRDFSRAINGGTSERGIQTPNWFRRADNLYGRPYRAARVRPGSRDLSTGILSDAPHSLMAFYSAGGNKLFVAAGSRIFEAQGGAYAAQTLPATHLASGDILSHTNLNGLIVATQRGGALTPLEFDGTSWKELKLPKPGVAPGFAADSAHAPAAGVDAGDHYYRVRWRHRNGSSLSGPVSAKHTVTAGANQKVNLSANLAPGVPRDDYLGFTVERTKINGDASGPFWFVEDVDSPATTYADVIPDASLGYFARDTRHQEPIHFDGITSFANRLVGWAGSTLYISNAIGDLEGTGIANFNFDTTSAQLIPVAKDDGDTIQVCVVVVDQLLILKKRSVHVLDGFDPDSYVLRSVAYADSERGSEAGCAGPRAATVIGGRALFWGDGGLFAYDGSRAGPVAWQEVGHYIDTLNTAQLDLLLLINHQGQYALAWYPTGTLTRAGEQIVYDARLKQWWHWAGWNARDAIELKSGLFSNASLVIADPRNRSTFPALTNGWPVTGAGIQANSHVNGSVAAGVTSFVLDLAANATAQNVTLTINGVATPHCNTTNGNTTVTISEYHLWACMESFMDERTSTGTGGVGPLVNFETPWLDGGLPDDWKDLDRIAVAAEGSQVALTVAIATDPPGSPSAVQLSSAGEGNDWCQDAVSNPGDLEWDVGDWAADGPTEAVSGIQPGTIGKRFKLTGSCQPTGDFQLSGIEVGATLLPDKEYDR